MRKFLLLGLVAAGSMFSAPILTVIPTLGPDFVTSGNFSAWAANVIQGLRTTSPQGAGVAMYTALPNGASVPAANFIESASGGFNSWQGSVAAATGSFANEQGTALYFALKIIDNQGLGTIQLSVLRVTETYLGQSFGTSPVGGNYRSTLIGIDVLGNVVGSGASNQFVRELYYVGVGFVQPLDLGAGGTNQDRLNSTAAQVAALANRTTQVCYTLGNLGSACGNVTVPGTQTGVIPEPGTMVLLGAGLAGLALLRRRSA